MSKIQQIIEHERERRWMYGFVVLLKALDILADEIRMLAESVGKQNQAMWQKCPICNGGGVVSGCYYSRAGDYISWGATSALETCGQCNGTGLLKTPKG